MKNELPKTKIDEKTGIEYRLEGDYYIPINDKIKVTKKGKIKTTKIGYFFDTKIII